MPKTGAQGIAEMGIGTVQTGIQSVVKEIGSQARQTGQAAASQLNITQSLTPEEQQQREAEQKKEDEEEIAKRKKELQQIHREEVDRLTHATTAPKPVSPPPEESTEPKKQVVPPLGQPLLPSSPERGSSFKPTKGKPFVGTTAIGTQEGGKRKG